MGYEWLVISLLLLLLFTYLFLELPSSQFCPRPTYLIDVLERGSHVAVKKASVTTYVPKFVHLANAV